MAILFADSFNAYGTLGVSTTATGASISGWEVLYNAGYEKVGLINSSGWYTAGVSKGTGKNGNSCRMSTKLSTIGNTSEGPPDLGYMFARKITKWERFVLLSLQIRLTKSYTNSTNTIKIPLLKMGAITIYAQNDVIAGVQMYRVFVNDSLQVGRFDSAMWQGLEVEVNAEQKKLRVYISNLLVWESDAADLSATDFKFPGYVAGNLQHLGIIDLESLVIQDGSGPKNNERVSSLAVTSLQPNVAVQENFVRSQPSNSLIYILTDTSLPTGYTYDYNYMSSGILGKRDLVRVDTLPELLRPVSVLVTTASKRGEPDSLGIKPVVKYKNVDYLGVQPINVGAWRNDRHVMDAAPDGLDWTAQDVLDLTWGYETAAKSEDPLFVNGAFDYLVFGSGTTLDVYKGDVDATYLNPSPPEFVPPQITIENSGPGSKLVAKGTRALGYFGVVPNGDVFPETQLNTMVPLAEGSEINTGADWLKFVNGGQVLFVAKKPLRSNISWKTLYQAGLVNGVDSNGSAPLPAGSPVNQLRIIKSGGFKYRLRLLQGADADPSVNLYNVPDPDGFRNSEWTRLLMRCSTQDPSATFWERFTDDDLGHTLSGVAHLSWCKEAHPFSATHRVSRGYPNITGVAATEGNTTAGGGLVMAWRPCLEYIGIDETYVPPSGIPGPATLEAGDAQLGYYGTVTSSEMLKGSDPATLVGLSVGTPINTTTDWLKFAYQGKILFVPKKPLRRDVSWDAIYAAGAVYGVAGVGNFPSTPNVAQNKTVTIDGNQFLVRLFKGADSDPCPTSQFAVDNPVGVKNSEWSQLMGRVWENDPSATYWERFTEVDMGYAEGGKYCGAWCQEQHPFAPATRVIRNYYGFLGMTCDYVTSTGAAGLTESWWPVFELVP